MNKMIQRPKANREDEAGQPQWYIARTNHNQERLARFSLLDEGFEVYLPFYARQNKGGEICGAPLFPGYVFIQMVTGVQGWTKVFSARGVNCVLGSGGRPTAVHDRIVSRIRGREFDGFVRMGLLDGAGGPTLKAGQAVKLRKGDKVDPIDAVFVEQLDKKRCLVLINLLGDKRIAQAALAHVE